VGLPETGCLGWLAIDQLPETTESADVPATQPHFTLATVLKKISVIFYLRNLCPVEVPLPPPLNAMVIDADPTPAWLAVFGLMALSTMVLAYSAWSARHTEISYGD
jgi:hypothetical protein